MYIITNIAKIWFLGKTIVRNRRIFVFSVVFSFTNMNKLNNEN